MLFVGLSLLILCSQAAILQVILDCSSADAAELLWLLLWPRKYSWQNDIHGSAEMLGILECLQKAGTVALLSTKLVLQAAYNEETPVGSS